ncbi:MAG: AI-2E family transporter [Candidatus Koribacter versatilis]|uniref:AI-2E family transporter n=1 Tax=Candidatus Korobacter versatilis TaxID=658062 RepID=A0A932A9A4_9BACT|nr:AI-2E family transporter [Candidatus Koribacter versatilis]
MASDQRSQRSNILFAYGVALFLVFLYLARDVVLLVYISALSAVVIFPGVEQVQKLRVGSWHPSRGLAILLVIVGVLALLTVFFIFALPPIFHDLRALATEGPARTAELSERLRRIPYADRLDTNALQGYAAGAVGGMLGLFKGVAGGVLAFFSWLVMTAYFIIDGEHVFDWAMSLSPKRHRQRLEPTVRRAQRRVRNWLIGQGALMLILGTAAFIVFGAMQLKYFYLLAVVAGLANIIPIVGPIVTVVLASLVAATDSWTKVGGVLIFYLVYQQVENAFLTPRIMKSTVDLPPVAVIVALALGGAVAGIAGALIAVPTAAWVAVLIDEYVVKENEPASA